MSTSRAVGARCLSLLLAASLLLGPQYVVLAYAQSAAQAAPAPHFGLGLAAHPDSGGLDGWMPQSGIPWDYAYQYLSGGANTADGWATWSREGTFALSYARKAASHGYMPVFTYYQLLQSSGPCAKCDEGKTDLANLNSPPTMAAYYQDFTLLMKRLGSGTYDGVAGFGGAAIVQVEPDLGGTAQQAVLSAERCFGNCTGQGNDPALLKAAVASSGNADVAAYPNTFQGFNWALLHLRDLYAPNVLLAYDLSTWATGTDLAINRDEHVDPARLGTLLGQFALQSGAGRTPSGTRPYDLLFASPSDRDAAYYQQVHHSNRWWDPLNATLPHFHQWEQYLNAARIAANGTPIVLWQVPIGNQQFQTENNTNGHWQDNRAEYFFSHLDELVNVGIVGILFGAGDGNQTHQYDARKDGITNPPPVCNTVLGAQVCPGQASTVADDDGGFLRLAATRYYQQPLALPASGARLESAPPGANTPDAPAPSEASPSGAAFYTTGAFLDNPNPAPGDDVPITIIVGSNAVSSARIRLEVRGPDGLPVFQQDWDAQPFGEGESRLFSTQWSSSVDAPPGTYVVRVGVVDAGQAAVSVVNEAAAELSLASR